MWIESFDTDLGFGSNHSLLNLDVDRVEWKYVGDLMLEDEEFMETWNQFIDHYINTNPKRSLSNSLNFNYSEI